MRYLRDVALNSQHLLGIVSLAFARKLDTSRLRDLWRRHLEPLALLVAAIWMVVGGLLLAGYEVYSLITAGALSGLILGGGLIMSVGGVVGAMFVLRRLGE